MNETVVEKNCDSGRKVRVTITDDGRVVVENPLSANVIYNMMIGGERMVDFEPAGQDYIAVHTTCDSNGVTAELSRRNDSWWSMASRPAMRLLPGGFTKAAQHFFFYFRRGGAGRQFDVMEVLPIKAERAD
jgi:hypothetical protein